MTKLARIVVLSMASGMFWAAVAIILGRPMGRLIWGGVVLAPLIGLGAGFASAQFPLEGCVRKAMFSLVSLYAAAVIFGIGIGVYDLLTGTNPGNGSRRIPSELVIQAVIATLWGLTFTGYVVVLWPLSYVNHAILSKAWKQSETTLGATG